MMKIHKMFQFVFAALAVTVSVSAFAVTSVFHNQATVVLKAGQVERYLQAAQNADVFKETRKEPGNISYVSYQSVQNPQVVIFDEIWRSEEALGQHLGTPHMQAFFGAINFNPALYNITQDASGTTFMAKPETEDVVIEKLVLSGFQAVQLGKR
jgi:quinol monooxygenase YgiN